MRTYAPFTSTVCRPSPSRSFQLVASTLPTRPCSNRRLQHSVSSGKGHADHLVTHHGLGLAEPHVVAQAPLPVAKQVDVPKPNSVAVKLHPVETPDRRYKRAQALGAILVGLGHRGDCDHSVMRIMNDWRGNGLLEVVEDLPLDGTSKSQAFDALYALMTADRDSLTVGFLYGAILNIATNGWTNTACTITRMYGELGSTRWSRRRIRSLRTSLASAA